MTCMADFHSGDGSGWPDGWHFAMFPCLADNYGYLLHNDKTGTTLTIDTPDAGVIDRQLQENGWQLTNILNTHHHHDHAGGNLALKEKYHCAIHGPADDGHIPGLDHPLADGAEFELAGLTICVMHTPGHTLGHIVYHLPEANVLFAGDTLFSMGCGRLFEGTPEQMWHSLSRIMSLPEQTRIYCAHEYTQANARFALTLEPDNTALQERLQQVHALRTGNRPTLPVTLAEEKKTNPFLRPHSPEIRTHLHMNDDRAADVDVFAEIRRRKDAF